MSTNWDKIDEQYQSKYKDYAPEGKHTTHVAAAEYRESSLKKTPGIQFTFEDNDSYAFPKFGCTHWLSFKNDEWRMHHFKELMKVLGASEEDARKAVDACEGKKEQKDICKAYEAVFKKLADKHPEVEAVVYFRNEDSQYADVDFADRSVRMGKPEGKKEEKVEDILADSEEADDLDIPF